MTTTGLQGITGYQLQIQSMSSKITELTKAGDTSSMSIASALKQQMSGIKSQLYTARQSNDRIMFQSYDKNGRTASPMASDSFSVLA